MGWKLEMEIGGGAEGGEREKYICLMGMRGELGKDMCKDGFQMFFFLIWKGFLFA